jgi:hypothetical protein
MVHIEEEHIHEVCSWPTTCPCNTKAEDVISLRHHLSDAHGYWKAEWRIFGRKKASEKDKNEVHQLSTPNPEDARETKTVQKKKTCETRRQVHRVVSVLQGAVSRSTFFKAATTGQKENV